LLKFENYSVLRYVEDVHGVDRLVASRIIFLFVFPRDIAAKSTRQQLNLTSLERGRSLMNQFKQALLQSGTLALVWLQLSLFKETKWDVERALYIALTIHHFVTVILDV
jgi:hypothetical protein